LLYVTQIKYTSHGHFFVGKPHAIAHQKGFIMPAALGLAVKKAV
jgi:hypothetical protein